MAQVIDLLSWAALLGGGFFYVVGAIGLNRMPDIFTRMHAVSVSETLGVGLMVLGMLLQAGFTLVAVKLIIILLVMWTTGAVATHALARAALTSIRRSADEDVDAWALAGEPDQVMDGIARYREALGMTHLIARVHIPDIEPKRLVASLELLAQLRT